MWSVYYICLTQACKVLLDAGCDLDAKASSGGTALMFAAAAGYTDVVKLLLEKGADVNATVKVMVMVMVITPCLYYVFLGGIGSAAKDY